MTLSTTLVPSDEAKQVRKPGKIIRRNELIHARYRMTLQEKRLLLWLMSQIRQKDTAFLTYRVGVKELAAALGLENNNDIYGRIAHYTELLMTRVAKVHRIGENTLTQVQFLSKTKYYFGDGIVELCLNEHMRPYLLDVKGRYTELQFSEAIELSSFYAVRIYEILMCEHWHCEIYDIDLASLREKLGIEPGKLERTDHFREKVLDIAAREINNRTGVRYTWEWIKTGKLVTGVRFMFLQKDVSVELGGLAKQLIAAGVSHKDARSIAETWEKSDPERVVWALKELRRLGSKVRNRIGWLKSAINDDYRTTAKTQTEVRLLDQADRKREAALRTGSGRTKHGRVESLKDLLVARQVKDKVSKNDIGSITG